MPFFPALEHDNGMCNSPSPLKMSISGWALAKYSSVSSVIERTKAMIAKDRTLRHRVEELKEEISKSQEQT